MAMPDGRKAKRRRSCLALSCFGGSPDVADPGAVGGSVTRGGEAPWFSWTRFRERKKTVPVDAPPTEVTAPEKIGPGGDRTAGRKGEGGEGRKDGEEKKPQKRWHRRQPRNKTPSVAAVEAPDQGFFRKLQEGNTSSGRAGSNVMQLSGSPTEHSSQYSRHRQRRQQQQPCLPSTSTRSCSLGDPMAPRASAAAPAACCSQWTSVPSASFARTTNDAGTPRPGGTRSRNGRQEPASVGKHDQVAGLSVLALVLLLVVLVGRVSAVVCTCVWLYLLPRPRAAAPESTGRGSISKCSTEDEFDSDYKKRVVLEGLLERSGRRPRGCSSARVV